MVGVRNSKGCRPCRRKKRGCDLIKPTCGQCLKIGAKCAYEDQSWVFVAQQQQCATTDRPPTLARASPFLLGDPSQQSEIVHLRACLRGEDSITGNTSWLQTSGCVERTKNTSHEVTKTRTSHLHGHIHTNCPRDTALVIRKQCILTAKDVARDRAVIAHIEATIFCFRSPVVERVVGMTMWVEAFIPPSAWSSSVPASALGAWALPGCRSHEYGNDAVALLNIGCSNGDDRLTLAGRQLYLATIKTLRNDIACSSAEIRGIFAALLDLMLASCYTVVSPGAAIWLDHLAGQTCLLKTRLTDFKSTEFCAFLLKHYRQLNLMRSLICRKGMPLATDDWSIGIIGPSSGSTEAMYRLAVKIPALLELADQLVTSKNNEPGEESRLENAVLQLESSLLEWFKAWIDSQPSRKPLASILNYATGTSEQIACLCFEESLIVALVWCLLLLLHESVYKLTRSRPSSNQNVTGKLSFDKANTYATLLTQSVYHLHQQAGAPLSKGLAVSAPLRFLKCWFDRICDIGQVERCIALERSLQENAPYLDWEITSFWGFLPVNWLLDEGAQIAGHCE